LNDSRTELEPTGALVLMFGQAAKTGGSRSRTITLNEQLALAAALLAVQLTRFVPVGKNEPDGGLQVTTPSPLAVNAMGAPHWPWVFVAIMSAGQMMKGGWAS